MILTCRADNMQGGCTTTIMPSQGQVANLGAPGRWLHLSHSNLSPDQVSGICGQPTHFPFQPPTPKKSRREKQQGRHGERKAEKRPSRGIHPKPGELAGGASQAGDSTEELLGPGGARQLHAVVPEQQATYSARIMPVWQELGTVTCFTLHFLAFLSSGYRVFPEKTCFLEQMIHYSYFLSLLE